MLENGQGDQSTYGYDPEGIGAFIRPCAVLGKVGWNGDSLEGKRENLRWRAPTNVIFAGPQMAQCGAKPGVIGSVWTICCRKGRDRFGPSASLSLVVGSLPHLAPNGTYLHGVATVR